MAVDSDLARVAPQAMNAILDSSIGRCSDAAPPDGPHRAAGGAS